MTLTSTDSKSMLVSKKVQEFKNKKSRKLKCQGCGPNKLNRCHRHFSFQALQCFFANSLK